MHPHCKRCILLFLSSTAAGRCCTTGQKVGEGKLYCLESHCKSFDNVLHKEVKLFLFFRALYVNITLRECEWVLFCSSVKLEKCDGTPESCRLVREEEEAPRRPRGDAGKVSSHTASVAQRILQSSAAKLCCFQSLQFLPFRCFLV